MTDITEAGLPTMGECERARAVLEEYLHNELCSSDAADIRDHMATCAECSNEHRVGIVLRNAVQRSCNEAAPEDLRSQVLAAIRLDQSTH
jgi:anti-sigma factor (TIGR02949 family)